MKTSTFQALASHLVTAIKPLKDIFSSDTAFENFFTQFGWAASTRPAAYTTLANSIETLIADAEALQAGANETDYLGIIEDIGAFYQAIQNLSSSAANAPSGVVPAVFLSELAALTFDWLLVKYLKEHNRKIYSILQSLGIIKVINVPAAGSRTAYWREKIDYTLIGNLISDPLSLIKSAIGWNITSTDLFQKVFKLLFNLTSSFHILASKREPEIQYLLGHQVAFNTGNTTQNEMFIQLYTLMLGTQAYDFGFRLFDSIGSTPQTSGFILSLDFPSNINLTQPINDSLSLSIEAASLLGKELAVLLTPSTIAAKFPPSSNTTVPQGKLRFSINFTPENPYFIFGNESATNLNLPKYSIAFEVNYSDGIEIIAEVDLSGLSLVINPVDTDNFISKIFGGERKKLDFPIIIRWSSKTGITFKGSGSFEYTANAHFKIGQLEFNEVKIAIQALQDQKKVNAEVGTNIKTIVGPITITANNIGLGFSLGLTAGNAGPFDIGSGFKPPTGVGLSINTEPVKGSGFLSLDSEKGVYSGAFQLSFSKFKLNAVGILNTRLPDGAPGYSLLILITAEFNPIQIGLGFTLNGVGGMLGLHRTLDADALQDALRSGGLENILFPQNVSGDASSIISTLNTLFPISEGRFLIAPMAKIGWGTLPAKDASSLLTIDLGILLELPKPVRLAVVGVLRCVMPTKENPLLVLNCAFAGIIDFDRQYVRFDARIYDSRIKNLTLSGMMALRIFWGRQKEMLISVGGFHPAYTPPVLLHLPRVIERMAVSLNEGSLQMRLEVYYALTSNTVQLGASLRLAYSFYSFKAEGHLSFDALFQFNPFYFNVRIQAGVSISWSGNELMGVHIDFMLEGPKPWHAKGYAEFEVLGCSKKLQLDKSWGGERSPEPRPIIALRPQVEAAFADKANWQTITPGAGDLLVSLRRWNDDLLVIHPNGHLQISQKIAPLDIALVRYGQAALSDPGHYRIDRLTIANVPQQLNSLKEAFSPAQYRDMNDADKLKAPSFEYLTAGVEAKSTADLQADYYVIKEVGYDEVIKDKIRRPRNTGGSASTGAAMDTRMVAAFFSGGLIGQNPVGGARLEQLSNAISGVQMAAPAYQVTDRDQLLETSTVMGVPLTFGSEAEARDYQQALGILAGFTKVIPSYYNA